MCGGASAEGQVETMQCFEHHGNRRGSPGTWVQGQSGCGTGFGSGMSARVWMQSFEGVDGFGSDWRWRVPKRCFCCGSEFHLVRDCLWMERTVECVQPDAKTMVKVHRARKEPQKLRRIKMEQRKQREKGDVCVLNVGCTKPAFDATVKESEMDSIDESSDDESLLSFGSSDDGSVDGGESAGAMKCVKTAAGAKKVELKEVEVKDLEQKAVDHGEESELEIGRAHV